MFLSPWNLVQAILFALGIWWCKEILSRWRNDLAKMRNPDDQADRVMIVILWGITVLVLLLCVGFALNIGGTIVRGIRDL
ncbi:MAG: hypothetical protein ABSE16_09320 [Verrucomicrobiota bacterium]|jgi:putative Mn2+ efflux pump MntP